VLKDACADPLGSQDNTYKNNNILCFKEGFNACFVMQFSATSQLIRAVDYNSIFPGTMIGMIADAGPVDCLGDVTTKPPASSFFYGVNAVVHHGYVVKLPDNTYGRIFVDSWVKPASGAVSEIHLTWQYAF